MILNTFPDLLTFSQLSPFFLRVALGLIIINLGSLKLGKEHVAWRELFDTINLHPSRFFVKLLAFIELIGGFILVIGAYTQLAAIIFTILFLCEAILEYREPNLEKRDLTFYVLVCTISLSLVFLGGGAFAIDLPL